MDGSGSLVIKVPKWLESHEFELNGHEEPPCRGGRCPLSLSSRWCGVKVQVSFSSLDHGSNLRDSSSIALTQLYRVTRSRVITLTHSLIRFGLAIHPNDHQARRRFVEWAQNEIAVVPDFHKRILFSDEAHFWLNGYVNKQNCRIWSEANPQVYVETPLHPEKLTVWCALWAGGILLQKQ
ncbi:hypothetical protein TNCV_563011 [Trichonephila clavipes]|nr:hypothetical protein TNCV_563011 [Trichonephila clavipes]